MARTRRSASIRSRRSSSLACFSATMLRRRSSSSSLARFLARARRSSSSRKLMASRMCLLPSLTVAPSNWAVRSAGSDSSARIWRTSSIRASSSFLAASLRSSSSRRASSRISRASMALASSVAATASPAAFSLALTSSTSAFFSSICSSRSARPRARIACVSLRSSSASRALSRSCFSTASFAFWSVRIMATRRCSTSSSRRRSSRSRIRACHS
mmetsp:Transcript_45603/g.121249  ORF Transcript_45603/g.121249 Transcript_45603/m.121249 type:complete len:215 (+) Transcript_45603:604-1248(+)